MTVYFATLVNDESLVKIGCSLNIERRLKTVAASMGDVRLIGTLPGGQKVEKEYHDMFRHLRSEGEWFKFNDEIRSVIKAKVRVETSDNIFIAPRTKAPTSKERKDRDVLIARKLLDKFVETHPRDMTLARCLEKAYEKLSEKADGWTRRRVRSIRETASLRVDLYEIYDLLILADVPRNAWSSWIDGTALEDDN